MDTTTENQPIQLLPEHIIDQIKAGEVIERPSTLIKEILENAIDAKATKIDLHLIENGLELISIKDNGIGINAKDLPLAFCRHATSKIDRFEDIYRLNSFGFRGEALASIASISKIRCQTKTKESTGLLKIDGGRPILHEHSDGSNHKTGTEIYIKDLFYNTPVRMKFIQSKTSEKNHLNKMIRSFLLMNPHVEFSIKWDQGEKEIYPIANSEQRIKETLFKNKPINLVSTQTDYDGVHFKIFLSQESSRGNAHKQHYLFINNRYVQDIQIHKIILNSAKAFWPEGESGHYIAQLFVPNDEIDVNVHPNKTVVKLFKAPKIYSIISGTIKSKIIMAAPVNEEPSNDERTLPLIQEEYFEKSIDYKQVDFNQHQNVENYIDHIHDHQPSMQLQTSQQYLHTEQFITMTKEDGLYLVAKSILLEKYLSHALAEINDESESVPLLVSRPIYLKSKINSKTEEYIMSLGFEFDYLDQKTLILRSFPRPLQHLPYIYILELLIKNYKVPFTDVDLDKFTQSTLNNALTKNFEYFYQNGVIQKLTDQDLKKIYVQKK